MSDGPKITRPPPGLRLADLLTLEDQTDETRRLLLEDSAPRPARRQAAGRGVPMRSANCPYQDTPSRLGGRMNVSAYEELRLHTAGVLDGFAWLTRHRLEDDPALAGSAKLLYDVSYLGLTLPVVLFQRARDPFPPHDRLPAVVASIFKASRGLFSVAVALANQGGSAARQVDPADVVAFADRHGQLARRQPARVCAAPTRLIERTISVVLTGEGATPEASRMPEWVAFPTLWACYRVQDELSEALSTYRFVLDQLAPGAPISSLPRMFGERVPGTTGTFGQLTEAMLAHATSAQSQLNRLLGRDDQPLPLKVEALLDLL